MSADINAIQTDLRAAKLDGWLFYDFRGRDPIAQGILQLPPGMRTRRWSESNVSARPPCGKVSCRQRAAGLYRGKPGVSPRAQRRKKACIARSSRRSTASSHSRSMAARRWSSRRRAVSSAYCIFMLMLMPRRRKASRRCSSAALYSCRVTSSIKRRAYACVWVG
jgi:hypothetical protein